MAAAGQYKHPITIIKTTYAKDAYGSMVETDGDQIKTRARVMHNGGGRENEQGDIAYLYNQKFQVHRYVDCTGYDYVYYNNTKYRILSIEDNEDYQYKEITTEQIHD